jgi:hypothetical protein
VGVTAHIDPRLAAWPRQGAPVYWCVEVQYLRDLFFAVRGPAQAKKEGRVVELALGVVFRAAVVEAEFLVIEVEAGNEQFETVEKRVAPLGVNLGVVVVIVVP